MTKTPSIASLASLSSLSLFADLAWAQDPTPTPPAASSPTFEERLRALEERLEQGEKERAQLREQLAAQKAGAPVGKPAEKKWFDRLAIRGYGQFRTTSLFNEDNTPNLNVPNDRSVNEADTLLLRRGRVILSGDVTDHLFVYAQLLDFAGSTGAADQALQMRDFYGRHRARRGEGVPLPRRHLQGALRLGQPAVEPEPRPRSSVPTR